jgi:hypothetical protein
VEGLLAVVVVCVLVVCVLVVAGEVVIRVVWDFIGSIVEISEVAFEKVVVIDGTILRKLFWFNSIELQKL